MTTAVAGPRRRRSFALVWPPVVFGLAALLLWELLVTVTGIRVEALADRAAVRTSGPVTTARALMGLAQGQAPEAGLGAGGDGTTAALATAGCRTRQFSISDGPIR